MTRAGLVALAAAAAFAAAAPARAEPGATRVRRGDLIVTVQLTGTVVPEGVARLQSPIDGRIEEVSASTNTWYEADVPLATLADKELAAILDTKGNQNQDVLEDRWKKVYRALPTACSDTCFILRSYAKRQAWVKASALLFDTARRLKLVGRVRPEDVPWVRDGMEFEFWPVADPQRRLKGRIHRYVIDIQGEKVEPGASFALDLGPERWFPPGTEWEGVLTTLVKKNVLLAPTSAFIHYDDGIYLPVRVSTGVSTRGLTEILAGIEERREILIPDDSRLPEGFTRHKAEVAQKALEARLREQKLAEEKARADAEAKARAEAAAAGKPLPEKPRPEAKKDEPKKKKEKPKTKPRDDEDEESDMPYQPKKKKDEEPDYGEDPYAL